MAIYATEEDASRRIEKLKTFGIWPGGPIRCPGGWRLTYDPPVTVKGQLDAYGTLVSQ
jgi:hypothetical protein